MVNNLVPTAVFQAVERLTDALQRTYRLAGMCDKTAADACSIEYCHFQRMMRPGDPRNFPPDEIETLLRKCGNNFALEWQAWRLGLALYPLELVDVLNAIRDALQTDGRAVNFLLGGRASNDTAEAFIRVLDMGGSLSLDDSCCGVRSTDDVALRIAR